MEAAVELVPDEPGGLRQADGYAVAACEQSAWRGVGKQIGVVWRCGGRPGQPGRRFSRAKARAGDKNVGWYRGEAGQGEGSAACRPGCRVVGRFGTGYGDEGLRGGKPLAQGGIRGDQFKTRRDGRFASRLAKTGAKFIEPGNAAEAAGEQQATFEGAEVVQLNQSAGADLVGDVKAELAQHADLAGGRFGGFHLRPHGAFGGAIALAPDQRFRLLAGHRIIDSVPVGVTGAAAQLQGTRSAG